MIKISWDQGFKRIYRKESKERRRTQEQILDRCGNVCKDPFQPRLRTHKLTGRLEGLWAFSVNFDCRVIFKFISKTEILLIDIGGHDEVYWFQAFKRHPDIITIYCFDYPLPITYDLFAISYELPSYLLFTSNTLRLTPSAWLFTVLLPAQGTYYP